MIMRGHKIAWLRPLLSAAILATGFGAVWFATAVWLGTTFDNASERQNRLRRERLVITADGTLLVETVSLDNVTQTRFRDLDGREHDPVRVQDEASAMSLFRQHGPDAFRTARPEWRQRIERFANEQEPAEAWYFVHDGKALGSGYFVGYERTSKRRIGYIGLRGFRTQSLPSGERIPARGAVMLGYANWSSAPPAINWTNGLILRVDHGDVPPRLVHVPSENLVRVVDLAARTTTTVFEAPTLIDSVGVPDLSSQSARKVTKELPIVVMAADTIYRLDHKYHVIGQFTVPAEVGRHSYVAWYETENGRAIAVCSGLPQPGDAPGSKITPTIAYVIGAGGAIQATHRLALRTGANGPSERAQSLLMAVGLPAPAVLAAAEWLMTALEGRAADNAASLAAALKRSWPFLAASLAVASVLAAAAWRRCRRFGIARPTVWVVFVVLFGIPGFAGFLLHRRWTTGDRRARTEFESPVLKGIEIFA